MADTALKKKGAEPARKPAGGRRAAGSVTETIYRTLLELIESRRLAPGDMIEERRLAEELNVSRTPLRASISRLLGEGALQQLSNGSVVVRTIGIVELLEMVHVRIVLESDAASLAARRIPPAPLETLHTNLTELLSRGAISKDMHWTLDDEVHDLIATHCGNNTMAHMIREIRQRIRMCNVERMPERLAPAIREHIAITDALIRRDSEGAREAMIDHLVNVRQGMLQSFGFLQYADRVKATD